MPDSCLRIIQAKTKAVRRRKSVNNATISYKLGNMERAADELMRAYMGLDDEAWLDENPKYPDFLATVAEGIENHSRKNN